MIDVLFEKVEGYWCIVAWIMGLIVGYVYGYLTAIEGDKKE